MTRATDRGIPTTDAEAPPPPGPEPAGDLAGELRGPTEPTPRRGLAGALSRAVPIVAAIAGIVVVWYAVTYLVLDPRQRFLLPPPHAVFGRALTSPAVMGPMLEARAGPSRWR